MAGPVRSKWKPLRSLYKQAIIFAFLFGVGFGLIGLVEYRFAVWQQHDGERADLTETVNDVSANLLQNGRWDLAKYRQWDSETLSSYFILEDTGQLIDVKGDPTDLLRSTLPADEYLPRRPTFIKTDLGETWLIQNRRIGDENVIGGIDAADLIGLSTPQILLARELAKYGSTVQSVAALDPVAIRNFVTGIMTVKDSGEISDSVSAGVPLRVRAEIPDQLLDGNVETLERGGEVYTLLSRNMSTGRHSATIIAFDDMDTSLIDQSLRFNLLIAGTSWLVAFLGYIVLALRNKLRQNARDNSLEISTRQLIAQGENAPVEFKETLRWSSDTNQKDNEVHFSVLKTLAAFLNTDGGTLLIGVADDRTIRGLARDNFAGHDDVMLHLTNLLRDRLVSSVKPDVTMRVEIMDNSLEVLRVDCKPATAPVYVKTYKNPAQLAFYVRTGPATLELPLDKVHPYIRAHFDGEG